MEHEPVADAKATPSAAIVPPGLTTAEVRQRLAQSGANVISEDAPPPWRTFLRELWAPIPWMLEVAILIQLARGSYGEAAAIAGLLVFNATLSFIQEGRAGATLAALKSRLALTALVRRDGEWVKRLAAELVPGDAIRLPLGAVVPADANILSGAVTVDQSMLTGESVPVEAEAGARVYAGAIVRRGQAVAEVTATGAKTYFGRAAELVHIAHAASTEQAAIFAVTRNLVVINGMVAVVTIAVAYAMALPTGDLIRLGLTALLATIPVALPTTFTLSAAFGAEILGRHGVLLTRLSAAHEAAAMDTLCCDKTGTLTQNTMQVVDVVAMPGFDRARVVELAAMASSEAGQDPIDAAIRAAAAKEESPATTERLVRFVPFDPATRMSEAFIVGSDGNEFRVAKGAFQEIARLTIEPSAEARRAADDLAEHGSRVIAVAVGAENAMRFAGLIALSDPPREDSAALIADLRDLNVRTVMVTGDSAITAAAVAGAVGISGVVCPPEHISDDLGRDQFGVFARVVPEEKYRLVKILQSHGHVVGMCGDGVNDGPALRQAQIGIAVSTATDVAKSAAGVVLTEPGLAGVVFAVREGRIGFRRLLTYTSSMLVKKVEIVLFLLVGLALTGHPVLTPSLMVLLFVTNDILTMSLATDRASPARSPSIWHMRNITAAAVALGLFKLGFSTAVLAFGKFQLGLGQPELQTLAFVTLVFGSQALPYVLRERGRMWSSKPSNWVLASSIADIVFVSLLAAAGGLMQSLRWPLLAAVLAGAIGFALVLDQIKPVVMSAFKVD